ncbi:hypothetical protein CC1G_01955 [Coprinopsis cinerea okayama7|uniref:RRM domain-containing protein n=1 Tax=Coprinopsis cinerea (strain Okayama-7 / 130 / ATCC MYA-4618 / FGSC 9003) TaxID=240176 RepID=A8N633_COPC7|nr:hypothetical protein CC1G_01955 [Coprinopsis cinerea okayama7\|eukprot:XP_001830319.2 hypothetical protein CC1G_01955 [Coprinopsis cinerea okayama7\
MTSLLERLSAPSATGPVRSKSSSGRASGPYNRNDRPPKGDIDSQWSHDLFESHNSLSARLGNEPVAPKAGLNNLAQKALREATGAGQLSIKGASSKGNVVDVRGLAAGTTAEDVAAIFKQCGAITDRKLMEGGDNPRVRLHFKTAAAASSAVAKFHNQPADGKILQVTMVGTSTAGQSLASRFGEDGLGLVREEGSVDVLMDTGETNSGSKLRSDALLQTDPRAQVLVAPPGANPADYVQGSRGRRGGGGRGGRGRRGRGGKRGGGGGDSGGRMDTD